MKSAPVLLRFHWCRSQEPRTLQPPLPRADQIPQDLFSIQGLTSQQLPLDHCYLPSHQLPPYPLHQAQHRSCSELTPRSWPHRWMQLMWMKQPREGTARSMRSLQDVGMENARRSVVALLLSGHLRSHRRNGSNGNERIRLLCVFALLQKEAPVGERWYAVSPGPMTPMRSSKIGMLPRRRGSIRGASTLQCLEDQGQSQQSSTLTRGQMVGCLPVPSVDMPLSRTIASSVTQIGHGLALSAVIGRTCSTKYPNTKSWQLFSTWIRIKIYKCSWHKCSRPRSRARKPRSSRSPATICPERTSNPEGCSPRTSHEKWLCLGVVVQQSNRSLQDKWVLLSWLLCASVTTSANRWTSTLAGTPRHEREGGCSTPRCWKKIPTCPSIRLTAPRGATGVSGT